MALLKEITTKTKAKANYWKIGSLRVDNKNLNFYLLGYYNQEAKEEKAQVMDSIPFNYQLEGISENLNELRIEYQNNNEKKINIEYTLKPEVSEYNQNIDINSLLEFAYNKIKETNNFIDSEDI